MTHFPFPVVAVHNIRRGPSPLVPTGTPGEITGISGATPSHYDVTFRLPGVDGATVTIHYLTRTDLADA